MYITDLSLYVIISGIIVAVIYTYIENYNKKKKFYRNFENSEIEPLDIEIPNQEKHDTASTQFETSSANNAIKRPKLINIFRSWLNKIISHLKNIKIPSPPKLPFKSIADLKLSNYMWTRLIYALTITFVILIAYGLFIDYIKFSGSENYFNLKTKANKSETVITKEPIKQFTYQGEIIKNNDGSLLKTFKRELTYSDGTKTISTNLRIVKADTNSHYQVKNIKSVISLKKSKPILKENTKPKHKKDSDLEYSIF